MNEYIRVYGESGHGFTVGERVNVDRREDFSGPGTVIAIETPG